MTRVEWRAEWDDCFKRLRAKGYDPLAAQRTANEITTARYGKQPQGLPIWARLALKVMGRKLTGLKPVEEKTMRQRLTSAILFGLASVIAALQVNGLPSNNEGWVALVGAFVVSAWGKFSSNTTLLSPDRKVWTAEEREAMLKG